MICVVDASVVVKWVFRDPLAEPDTDRALQLLWAVREGAVLVIQPVHWLIEAVAVVARVRPEILEPTITLLDALEFPTAGEIAVLRRAATLANQLDCHLFDTLYHSVALERDATLVTADRRYLAKAREVGGIVRLDEFPGAIRNGSKPSEPARG